MNRAYSGETRMKWYLTKSNFGKQCAIGDNVSYVRFRTELDEGSASLFDKSRYLSENENALDKEVRLAFVEMSVIHGKS